MIPTNTPLEQKDKVGLSSPLGLTPEKKTLNTTLTLFYLLPNNWQSSKNLKKPKTDPPTTPDIAQAKWTPKVMESRLEGGFVGFLTMGSGLDLGIWRQI